MIFYTVTRGGAVLDWAGTQAEARESVKTLQGQSEHPADRHIPITWQEHDVPTDKPRLLAWLKANALGERKAKQSAETPRPNL